MIKKTLALIPFLVPLYLLSFAQISPKEKNISLESKPKEYEIGGITVSGAPHYDKNVIILQCRFHYN